MPPYVCAGIESLWKGWFPLWGDFAHLGSVCRPFKDATTGLGELLLESSG